MKSAMTWTCHICGKERPDEAIAVYKSVEKLFGATVQQNVRYCRDNPKCVERAPAFRFIRPKTNSAAGGADN